MTPDPAPTFWNGCPPPSRRREAGRPPHLLKPSSDTAGQLHRSPAPGGGLRLPEPAGAAAARAPRGHHRQRRGGDVLRRRPRRRVDPLRRRHHGRAQVRLLYGLSRRHQLPGWWPLDRTRALRPRPRLHDPRRAKAGAPGRAASSKRGAAPSRTSSRPLLPNRPRRSRRALWRARPQCRPIPSLSAGLPEDIRSSLEFFSVSHRTRRRYDLGFGSSGALP